jgi:hypothetical protein
MKNVFRIFLMTSVTLLGIAPFASAATTSTAIKGGSLSIIPPTIQTDFPSITLNGHIQTFNATLSDWSITDPTGKSNGWHVTAQATRFMETGVSNPMSLPMGSLTLSGTRIITAEKGSNNPDKNPVLLNQTESLDSIAPVSIVNAQKGQGMGTFSITEPTDGLTLTLVPLTTLLDQDNYSNDATPFSSTLTFSVITGP